LQDLIDTGAFAFDELAEVIARQKIAIPALLVEHSLPFLAFTQFAETLDPLFMIRFGHVDRTQNATPVGDFDVIARLFERRHVIQAFHALCGGHTKNTDTAFLGELLEFGDARNTRLQCSVYNTDDGIGATRLRNIVQLRYRYA